MKESLQRRPEIIGAIRRRSDNGQPFSFVLGFRNCRRNLATLTKFLKDEFGDPSEIFSGMPDHKLRQMYHRSESSKRLKRMYPEAESLSTETTATLDIWKNTDLTRCCEYITSVPPLFDIIQAWNYGNHATLHVTTCTDIVTAGERCPETDYVYTLDNSISRHLRDLFLLSHKRYQNNGYVIFREPYS